MPSSSPDNISGRISVVLASERAAALPNGELLARFLKHQDESAFAVLVHRYGALVLGVCRRTLYDPTDAEDAFQATFLVLARKASSIRRPEALASWLHGVAYRAARKLRTARLRREHITEPLIEVAEPDSTVANVTWQEVQTVLDDELARLPEAYRTPLVLCYLEGKTQDEAAQQLGWTLGALRGRLQRGRERLRLLLERRGLTLSVALLSATLIHAKPHAAVSAALEVATARAALLAVTGKSLVGAVSAQTIAVLKSVLQKLFLGKLLMAALLLGVGVVGASGALTLAYMASKGSPQDSQHAPVNSAAPVKLVRGLTEIRRFVGNRDETRPPWVTRVLLTPAGQIITAGDAVHGWDPGTGEQLFACEKNLGSSWGLALDRDGRRLIVSDPWQSVRIFDLETYEELRCLAGHRGTVWGAILSQDGALAVTGGADQTIRVWEVATGKQLRVFEGVHEHIRCLALSPDGKFLAAGHFVPEPGQSGNVRLWEVAAGKEVRLFAGHNREVSSVAFSADGKRLLTSSYDRTIRIWDVDSGKELRCLTGHTHRVEYAAFTPDERLVVSCGNEFDPTLRLWDVDTGKQVSVSEPVAGGLLSVAALPDGRHCVSTGKDGFIRIWQMD